MKKWLGVIGINIIIIALLLIIAEGILRWHYFGLPMDRQHLPHPYLQNAIRPSIEIRSGEFLDQNGSRMTGTLHEGKDVYKVLAIGDSCTFSVGASNSEKTYPALLEKKYHEQMGRQVEVYNAGVPGHNSMQMFLRLHYLLKDIQPAEVIIYGGWNDFRVLLHDRGELYIENNIESIICLAKGKGARVSIITLGSPLKKHYSNHEKDRFLEAFGNDPGNLGRLTPAEQYYYVERFNHILRMLARKHDTTLYDWDRWFDAIYDVSFFVDVVHPSDIGYKYMVDRIIGSMFHVQSSKVTKGITHHNDQDPEFPT